ncbi:hypothetical protein Gpo141_00007981 [Globisporangium polare]
MASRVRLTQQEKRAIYEKSLATPGFSLAKLADWAKRELNLVRAPGVSSVAAVLKQQAEQASRPQPSSANGHELQNNDDDDDGGDDDDEAHDTAIPRASGATARRPPLPPLAGSRVRMTLQERGLVYEKFRSTPDMKLRELGLWAAEQFKLDKVPGKSTLSVIIKRQMLDPPDVDVRNPDQKRKNIVKSEALRVESDLIKWIEATEQFGVALHGSQIRAYASLVRDELVELEADPQMREKLKALQFSKSWLYRFQQDRSRMASARAAQQQQQQQQQSVSVTSTEVTPLPQVDNVPIESGPREYNAW